MKIKYNYIYIYIIKKIKKRIRIDKSIKTGQQAYSH